MQVKVFSHYVHLPFVVLAVCEGMVLWLTSYSGLRFLHPQVDTGALAGTALIVTVPTLIAMLAFGMFSRRFRERTPGALLRILLASALGSAAAWVLDSTIHDALTLGPIDLLAQVPMCTVAAGMVRIIFGRILEEDTFRRRVLVFGNGLRAESIAQLRRRADQRGFRLIGFVRPDGETTTISEERLVDQPRSLLHLCNDLDIDEIVVAMDDRRRSFPVDQLLDCRLAGIDITEVVSFLERETGRVRIDVLHPSWLIFSAGFRRHVMRRVTSRVFDLLVGALLLVVIWPLLVLAVLAIKFEDGLTAHVLYRQKRVGMFGRVFDVLKFRSMHADAESDGRAQWASANDQRITRVGKVMRKTRIDELPQILNVMRGDMSFVGPRPERPEFVEQLSASIPYYRERHWVKPGITGWAQICYPYGASEKDAIEKLQYDLYYIKNQTLMFDVLILLQTVETVLLSKGAR